MPMLADLIDAVVGVDTHRDTHHVEIALPTGTPIAGCSITNDTSGYAQLLARIVEHAPGPASSSRSKAPAATASDSLAQPPPPACSSSSANNPTARPDAARANPTRSTPTSPSSPRYASTPRGCPVPAPTATAKHCASCSAPVTTSP